MLTESQQSFLASAAVAARDAGHIFPGMAACEAALESTWGTSKLAIEGHNLFGAKQQVHPTFGTIHIPTREFLHAAWVTQDAAWISFPSYAECFKARMDTLFRLSFKFPHYERALAAAMPEVFVQEVSLSWSTDPQRAEKCIAIYHAHQDILHAALK